MLNRAGATGTQTATTTRALVLRALCAFLKDPINKRRACDAFAAGAPREDQGMFDEVMESLGAGLEPNPYALDALFGYAPLFCGLTIRAGGGVEEDTGFAGDEPWE